ncbi:hypothetical protein MGN70_000867 [Eutypa lata]|nr:hypothetical protein MGN70_000867 [Eutypa lata]
MRATTGIGASVVSQLTDAGAEVTWGDIAPPSTPDPRFVQTDASSYASILNLFKTARERHGGSKPIDHAVCNAGVSDVERFFTTDESDAAIEKEPATRTLDVNLKGPLFFLRMAAHFLRRREGEGEIKAEREGKGKGEEGARSPSILLVSSNAGFIEFPGTYQYSASKHGVVGLFRSSKTFLLGAEGVRVNVVLPGLTRTPMTTAIVEPLQALGVACNEAEDVARVIIHALAASHASGEAYYVSGGKAYEIEKGLHATRPQWLGEQLDRETTIMQEAFAEQTISNHKLRKAGELKD